MPPDIRYIFRYRHGEEETVDIHHTADGELIIPDGFQAPSWTALSHHQCRHCPFSEDQLPACPVAVNIAYICERRTLGESHTPVSLSVVTAQREYRAETTVQRAMSALIGLVGAMSSCPYTRPLRAMAMTHLPLADERESLIRMASLHLLERYMRSQDDPSIAVSLDDLPQIYRDLTVLNQGMAKRLQSLGGSDAALNGMVLLDVLSRDIRFELDSALPLLRAFMSLPP